MSKNLSQLLGKSPSEVSYVLHKLESLSGYNSEDNKLLSEIRSKLWPKIAELGLDPADTTPDELYHAVQARYKDDSQNFSKIIGSGLSTSDKINNATAELISAIGILDNTWILKRKVFKDLLTRHQPKKLMKHLNYRSLGSMLKRENVAEILAAAMLLESDTWMKNLHKDMMKLIPSDFEVRPVEIVIMAENRWSIIKPPSNVTKIDILGSVVLWPSHFPAQNSLMTFIKIIGAVEDIELDNLALKINQVSPDFSKVLENYLKDSSITPKLKSAFWLYWHNLSHYYNYLPSSMNNFLSEPHMQDVRMRRLYPAKFLSSIHPVFSWWEGNEFLGVNSSNIPISLNLADASENVARTNDSVTATFRHLKHNLWNELLARYLAYPQLESEVVRLVNDGQYALNVPKEELDSQVNYRKLLQTA